MSNPPYEPKDPSPFVLGDRVRAIRDVSGVKAGKEYTVEPFGDALSVHLRFLSPKQKKKIVVISDGQQQAFGGQQAYWHNDFILAEALPCMPQDDFDLEDIELAEIIMGDL